MVDAKPREDGRQKCLWRFDFLELDRVPPDKRFLDQILGLAASAENFEREREQKRAVFGEDVTLLLIHNDLRYSTRSSVS
jgi:hypothetical protein